MARCGDIVKNIESLVIVIDAITILRPKPDRPVVITLKYYCNMSEDYDENYPDYLDDEKEKGANGNITCSSLLNIAAIVSAIIGGILFAMQMFSSTGSFFAASLWLLAGLWSGLVLWGCSIVVKAAEKYLNNSDNN